MIYNFVIFLYYLAVRMVMPFNQRARKMISGRKKMWEELSSFRDDTHHAFVVWIHAASVGEFEQAKPLIEKIRQDKPHIKILLTFFSPSGYELHRNYSGVDKVMYLPFDFPSSARKFVRILNPSLAIFVKYEFWLNFISQIHQHKVPLYLISAVFHSDQPFFKWYGKKFITSLNQFDFIFVQDEYSAGLLKQLQLKNYVIAGDTRFDRVNAILKNPLTLPEIENFAKDAFVIIAGSSYETEERMLLNCFHSLSEKNPGCKLILVPHHTNNENIRRLISLLKEYKVSFSRFSQGITSSNSVLVVDSVGVLSSIYRFGKLAVIGGGFKDGIHSILEPAVYGLPVLFGPDYKKFNEAIRLTELKASFVFRNKNELKNHLTELMTNEEFYKDVSTMLKSFTYQNCGATEKIFKKIQWPDESNGR